MGGTMKGTLKLTNVKLTIILMVLATLIFIQGSFAGDQPKHGLKLTVEKPKHGDVWEIGTEQTIEWDDDGHVHGTQPRNNRVILYLITDANSRRDSVPVDTVPLPNYVVGKGGKTTWTVDCEPSEKCRVFLFHRSNTTSYEGKGGMLKGRYFKIVPGTSIKLPNYSINKNNLLFSNNPIPFKVFDLNGQLVLEGNNNITVKELNNQIKSGIYLLKFKTQTNNATYKINLTK